MGGSGSRRPGGGSGSAARSADGAAKLGAGSPVKKSKRLEPQAAVRELFYATFSDIFEAFTELDQDADGILTQSDFVEGIMEMWGGRDRASVTDEQLDELFRKFDSSKEDQMTVRDFLGAFQKKVGSSTKNAPSIGLRLTDLENHRESAHAHQNTPTQTQTHRQSNAQAIIQTHACMHACTPIASCQAQRMLKHLIAPQAEAKDDTVEQAKGRFVKKGPVGDGRAFDEVLMECKDDRGILKFVAVPAEMTWSDLLLKLRGKYGRPVSFMYESDGHPYTVSLPPLHLSFGRNHQKTWSSRGDTD